MFALVVYIGKNTKIILNTQKRIFKRTSLEKKLEKYMFVIIIFIFVLIIGLILFAMLSEEKKIFEHNVIERKDSYTYTFFSTIGAYLILLN